MWARQCTPVRVPTPRWNQPAGLSVPASTSISGTSSCPAPASPPGLKVGPQPLGPLPLPTQRLSEGELLDLRGFQTSLHAIYLSQQGPGHLPELPLLLRKLCGGLRGCVGRDPPDIDSPGSVSAVASSPRASATVGSSSSAFR